MIAPASFLGLLAHDLKLSARGFSALFGALSRRRRIGALAVVFVILHLIAWPLAIGAGIIEDGPGGQRFVAAACASGALFALPWVVASAMTAVTRMLYQRSDFDLLLASPVSARKVLVARAFAIALDAVAPIILLLAPFVHVSALIGRWHWLALYPTLFACALFGAGVGLSLALALFGLVGARRARLISQIAATLIGASFVISAQVVAILPESLQSELYGFLSLGEAGGHGLGRLLQLPARAAIGEFWDVAGWMLVAAAVFGLAAVGFGPRFARAAQQTAGAPASRGRNLARARFRAHLPAALRLKEHRLLWRDPWLMSQMALQVFYTLPVSLILWRSGGVTGTAGVAFAPTLAVIAGQLSGSLAWIALSGEDAPEFLAAAPVTRRQVELGKLSAIAAPVAMVAAVPLLALSLVTPWGALCALGCGAGAGLSGALLNLWRQAPSRRGLVLRRHSQSKLIALVEHWLSLLWALATGLAVLGSWTFLLPVGGAVATLALLRPRRSALGASHGAAAWA